MNEVRTTENALTAVKHKFLKAKAWYVFFTCLSYLSVMNDAPLKIYFLNIKHFPCNWSQGVDSLASQHTHKVSSRSIIRGKPTRMLHLASCTHCKISSRQQAWHQSNTVSHQCGGGKFDLLFDLEEADFCPKFPLRLQEDEVTADRNGFTTAADGSRTCARLCNIWDENIGTANVICVVSYQELNI